MKLNNQPVKPVRVPPTRFDRVLDLVALFLVGLLWVLTIKFYIDAPEKVPTGFDAAGNPRGWGSPAFYFMMPAIGMFYGVSLYAATYFPQFINIPVVLREKTVVPQSALMIRCCRWLNIVGQLMFLFILFQMGSYHYEALHMEPSIFMIAILGWVFLMLGLIVYYCVRISRLNN